MDRKIVILIASADRSLFILVGDSIALKTRVYRLKNASRNRVKRRFLKEKQTARALRRTERRRWFFKTRLLSRQPMFAEICRPPVFSVALRSREKGNVHTVGTLLSRSCALVSLLTAKNKSVRGPCLVLHPDPLRNAFYDLISRDHIRLNLAG